MRFITFLKILSLDLEKVGWYIVRYNHFIETGKYNIQCQKIIRKAARNGEPFQMIITHNIMMDELQLSRYPAKELINKVIIELGHEDVKA